MYAVLVGHPYYYTVLTIGYNTMETKEEEEDVLTFAEETSPIRPYVPPIQVPVTVAEEIPTEYRQIRLLTSEYDNSIYGIPSVSHPHARAIWEQAGLPMNRVLLRFLEVKLIDWIHSSAEFQVENRLIRYVRIQTSTDCLYFCSWSAFLRWMILSCQSSVGQ